MSVRLAAGAAAVVALTSWLRGPDGPVQTTPAIERGRYLTHSVAMCVECHSPRDGRGTIIPSREFEGAPNPFPAPYGAPWAMRSVNLRSMARLDSTALVQLLTDGVARDGVPPDPPMPRFRLTRQDAEAIVAYLGSLP